MTDSILTVILTNKNHGHYLSDALASIRKQELANIDVIVIDGGSTDQSSNVASKFPGINFYSEPDLGGNHAFAKGIKQVRTKYVTFLTSTDFLLDDNWLQDATLFLEHNEDCSMTFAGIKGFSHDFIPNTYCYPTYKIREKDYAAAYFDWLFNGNGFTPISIVVRTEVLKHCLEPLSQFHHLDREVETDIFYKFSYNFFRLRLLSVYLGDGKVGCRLHTDRIDDRGHIGRHLQWLDCRIKEERKRILISKSTLEFLDAKLQVSRFKIDYKRFISAWLAWSSSILLRKAKELPRRYAAYRVYKSSL